MPRSRWARAALWTGALLLALIAVAFGYEVATGSPNPAKTLKRRVEAALRHQHLLPRRSWSPGGAGRGNTQFFGPDGAQVTLEYITKRDRVYALGFWPIGMNYTAREVSHDGPLDCQAVRLVWWRGTERNVVDTADRVNGRLPEGATSVEVKGWIPFEASRYGVEEFGTQEAPTEWREAWSNGYGD